MPQTTLAIRHKMKRWSVVSTSRTKIQKICIWHINGIAATTFDICYSWHISYKKMWLRPTFSSSRTLLTTRWSVVHRPLSYISLFYGFLIINRGFKVWNSLMGTYQVQTNLSVQTMQTSIWIIGSTSKERGKERWEGGFAKVWLPNPSAGD